MTFYIDLIFLVFLVCDFVVLWFTAKLLGIKIRGLRFIAGGAFLGVLNIKAFMLGKNYFIMIPETMLMLRFIFGFCSCAEHIRRSFVFFGVSLLFGAVMNVISNNDGGVFIKGGELYNISSKSGFFAGIIVSVGMLLVISFFIRNRRNLYNVEIITKDGIIKTTAFLDTGNRLTDEKSGKPVIIVESEILEKHPENTRQIEFKTVGEARSYMTVFDIQKLRLVDENREFENLYAGICEHKLSKNGEFHALLNSGLK